MKMRLISLIILIILIGGPVALYWYFVRSNISSLTIISDVDTPFHIDITGSFSYKYLPLADKLIEYHLDCQSSCSLHSIPPAQYTIRSIVPGYENQEETIQIRRGEAIVKHLNLRKQLYTIPYTEDASINKYEDAAILATYSESQSGVIVEQITRKGQKLYIFSQKEKTYSIGYLDGTNTYTDIFSGSGNSIRRGLDVSKNVYIVEGVSIDTLIDLESEKIAYIPHTDGISLVRFIDTIPFIRRGAEVGYYEPSGQFVTNTRYTDVVEVDSRYRLGYIDGSDTKRRGLQNITDTGGLLYLIDTSNGMTTLLKDNFSMFGFIRVGERYGYITSDGSKYIFVGILER